MRSATCSDESCLGDPSFDVALRAVAAAPAVPLEALGPPLEIGTCLDEFELLEVLGEGGMSVVYRARDRLLDRDVAIKVLNPPWTGPGAQPDSLLEQEARATARLRHPHIVTIHRVGSRAGRLYLVLELLEGETLAAHLRRGPLGADEAISIGLQLCEALAHAHANGIVHRDVKPGNVFLEDGRVKVLDFGLSSPRPTDDRVAKGSGAWAGTPAYMAPEQWRCEPADERTDVYSAGILLQELIGGRQARGAARARRWRWPKAATCPLGPPIGAIVARATAQERADRYPDARAMATALHSARIGRRRRRIGRIACAALAAALIAMVTIAVRAENDRPPPLPDLSGTWQADPAGFGSATLTRIDDDHYLWEHRSRPVREDVFTYYNRGILSVCRQRGRIVLAGRLADEPGWCCGNVGRVEIQVDSPNALHMVVSLWGKKHDEYGTAHPPYWFRRQADRPIERER
jgi:serine/threonine protein kinase